MQESLRTSFGGANRGSANRGKFKKQRRDSGINFGMGGMNFGGNLFGSMADMDVGLGNLGELQTRQRSPY